MTNGRKPEPDAVKSGASRRNRNMRFVATSVCVFGLFIGFAKAQENRKPKPPQFDPPAVISAADTAYPIQSVASGTVVLEASLDEEGNITDIRVVHGIPSLTEPAERSLRSWKFQAAQLNGETVHSKMVVAFSFVRPIVGPHI